MSKLSVFIFAVLAVTALAGPCYEACQKDCAAQGMDNEAVIYHVCTFKCGSKDNLGFSFSSIKDKIKAAAQKYGPKAQALIEKYGPKALELIEKYGPIAIVLIEAELAKKNLGSFKSFVSKVAKKAAPIVKRIAPIAKDAAKSYARSKLGSFKSFIKKIGREVKNVAKEVAPIAKDAAKSYARSKLGITANEVALELLRKFGPEALNFIEKQLKQ